jgi:hypothetical protein
MKTIACALMLAALPAVVAAAERPDWAFPPPGVTGAPRKPETGELKQVPGSGKTYTQSQIDSINDPPDWFRMSIRHAFDRAHGREGRCASYQLPSFDRPRAS